jgi:hypothetical protein
METLENKSGAFAESLKRNNKRIKEDRAIAISDDAELVYRRKVEDLEIEVKRLEREREGALDLSPDNTTTIIKVEDFSPQQFIDSDLRLTLQIRDRKIQLEEARERFKYLFNK